MKPVCQFLYHYLLASSTIAFACGICTAYYTTGNQPVPILSHAAFLLLTALLAISSWYKNTTTTLFATLGIIFLLGLTHCSLYLRSPASDAIIFNQLQGKKEIVATGRIIDMPEFDGQFSRTIVQLQAFRFATDKTPQATVEKLLITLPGPWPDSLMPGDIIVIRTTVKQPTGVKTPGVFSYESYLARKGIYLQGFVQSPLLIHRITRHDQSYFTPGIMAERIRTRFARYMDATLSKEHAGFYRALLLGDKSGLDQNTVEIFQKCGAMHILAISGLHLSILAGMVYIIFRWLITRSETLLLHFPARKTALCLTLPFLIFYCLVAGSNPPIVRAAIMSSCVIFACCINQQKHSFSLLALAALLILMGDPLQLFSLSFQLSFTAVFTILFMLPTFRQLRFSPKTTINTTLQNWFILAIAISLSITAVTAPLTLYSFNRFSLVGPLANLILEPLLCLLALPLGLTALPLHHIAPSLAQILLEIGSIAISSAVTISKLLAAFSFSELRLPTPSVSEIVSYYILLLIVAAGMRTKRNVCIVHVAAGLVFCIACYFFKEWGSMFPHPQPPLTITFIDVGQGSSSLVEMPSGYNILIDGGSSTFRSSDPGKRVLAPFLWKKGIRKLDAVIITHPDADHYNGIASILKDFRPRTIWVRDDIGHKNEYRELLDLAKNTGIEIVVPQKGMKLGDATGYAESITPASYSSALQANNNNSIVTKICTATDCILFPGDIEAPTEQQLINDAGVLLPSEVLLAPHHGSATSSSKPFLDCVNPQLIFVSAGHARAARFPSPKLRAHCRTLNVPLLNTAEKGTLQLQIAADRRFVVANYGFREGNPLLPMHYAVLLTDTFSNRFLPRAP